MVKLSLSEKVIRQLNRKPFQVFVFWHSPLFFCIVFKVCNSIESFHCLHSPMSTAALTSCLSSVFLPPLFFSSCHSLTASLDTVPPILSGTVVMEMLQTSRGISSPNSGVQGLGRRVTVGVGSQWEFSLYRPQWRQNLLGKAINWCLFVFPSVRLSVSVGLLTCLSV